MIVFRQYLRRLRRFLNLARGGQPGTNRHRCRPAAELLEDRSLPSVVFTPDAPLAPVVNRPDLATSLAGGDATGPVLEVNSADPGRVVVSAGNALEISGDAGATFTGGSTFPLPAGATGSAGSSLVSDAHGRLFWANLVQLAGRRDVAVVQLDPITGAQVGSIALVPNPSGNDVQQEFLAADANPASPFHDTLYLAVQQFDPATDESTVLVSHSTDHGQTWSSPVTLSVNSGNHTEGLTWSPTVTVAPNGDVCVAYHAQPELTANQVTGNNGVNPSGSSGEVILFRSTDGGASFTQRSVPFGPGQADVTFNRRDAANGGTLPGATFWTGDSARPWVLSDPARPGDIYVIAADDPDNTHGTGDDADVVIARSIDNGQTWTRATVSAGPINVPGFIDNSLQLFPTAAIDASGDIVIAWYDNRRGLTNAGGDFLLDVFATYSSDGGQTWAPDFMVNNPANAFDPDAAAPQRFAGPPPTTTVAGRLGMSVADGTAYVAWTGNSPGGRQVFTNAFPLSGTLTVNGDIGGTATDDAITMRGVAENPGFVEVVVNGQRQYAGLRGSLSGSLRINGLGGSNTLAVDFSNGNPVPIGGLSFDGGPDSQAQNHLVLRGGSFSDESFRFNGPDSGSITLDSSIPSAANVSFTGIRHVEDALTVNQQVFHTGSASALAVLDALASLDGLSATQLMVSTGTAALEATFTNKAEVVVAGGPGGTTFLVDNSHPAAGLQALTLDGGDAGNTFLVRAAAVPTTVNTGGGDDTATLNDGQNSLAGITAPLTVNGQGGFNTLQAANDADFTLTNTSLHSAAVDVVLSNLQAADLTGGPGDNTFDVSGWTAGGRLDGRSGRDTINATKDASFTLSDTALTVSDSMALALAGIEVATLTGGAGDNTFDVGDWTGTGRLDGGPSGQDTVRATRDADFILSDNALGDSDGLSLALYRIQSADLRGGPSPNAFTVSRWSGTALLDGRGGSDSYTINLSGAAAGTTTVADSGGAGCDTLTVNETLGGGDLSIIPLQMSSRGESVNYSGIEAEAVHGGAGRNLFRVSVSPTFAYDLTVDAGPSGTDLLAVTDNADYGVFHNHRNDNLSGLIEARYLGGLSSQIRYRGAEQQVLTPDADHSFVQALFYDTLGRAGTPREIARMVKRLHHHSGVRANRQEIVDALESRPEALRHLVAGWFLRYLGRAATRRELRPFAAMLPNASEEDVLSRLLAMPAFVRQAPRGQGGFVELLCTRVLGDHASAAELRQGARRLPTAGRQGVARWLLGSLGYRAEMAVAYYRGLLRQPGGTGFGPAPEQLATYLARHLDQRHLRLTFESDLLFFLNG